MLLAIGHEVPNSPVNKGFDSEENRDKLNFSQYARESPRGLWRDCSSTHVRSTDII